MGRKKLSYEEKLELLEKFWEAHRKIDKVVTAFVRGLGDTSKYDFTEEEREKYSDWLVCPVTIYLKRCVIYPEIEAKYKESEPDQIIEDDRGVFYICEHEDKVFRITELIKRANIKTTLTEEDFKVADEAYDFLETVDLRQLPKVIPMADPNDPENVIYLTFGDPNDFWEGRWGWDDEDDDEDDWDLGEEL